MEQQQVGSLALFQGCRMGAVGWTQNIQQDQALPALCHGELPWITQGEVNTVELLLDLVVPVT